MAEMLAVIAAKLTLFLGKFNPTKIRDNKVEIRFSGTKTAQIATQLIRENSAMVFKSNIR